MQPGLLGIPKPLSERRKLFKKQNILAPGDFCHSLWQFLVLGEAAYFCHSLWQFLRGGRPCEKEGAHAPDVACEASLPSDAQRQV